MQIIHKIQFRSSFKVEIHLDICVSTHFERVLSTYFGSILQVFLKYSSRKNCVLWNLSKLFIFLILVFFTYIFFELIFSNCFVIHENNNLRTKYLLSSSQLSWLVLILTKEERELNWAQLLVSKIFRLKGSFTNQVSKIICTRNNFLRCLENLSKAQKHKIPF